MSGLRIAKVTTQGRDTAKTVAAYLPANYSVIGMQGNDVLIAGFDNHGWTMDDYVIPRLGSGMLLAKELALNLEFILHYDPLGLLGD